MTAVTAAMLTCKAINSGNCQRVFNVINTQHMKEAKYLENSWNSLKQQAKDKFQ